MTLEQPADPAEPVDPAAPDEAVDPDAPDAPDAPDEPDEPAGGTPGATPSGAPDAAPPVLPDAVRRQLVELAAAVLGELEEAEAPPTLQRVRRFAPARRARAGAVPLGVALEREPVFRQRVATAWRALHPEIADALEAGEVPPAADPQAALAGAYLLRREGWEQVLAAAAAAAALADDGGRRARREERDGVLRELDAGRRELARLRDELADERARAAGHDEEVAALRRELRRHRSDADRARAAARAAEQAAEQVRAEAAAERDLAREQADRAAQELRQAREREEQARRAAREGRTLADVRARLLLDTIVDAATGLRRELALPPVDVRPADLEAPDGGLGPTAADRAAAPRGLVGDDPAMLEALVRLPRAHLVVDGYNVTKTAYPALPLLEQRRRLVDSLVPLAARTGAEVTCVFDGADVEARAAGMHRGVRVMFSEPGVSADEKIRRLVRAEPPGRVVVVVSTDGEVAADVRALGARSVPSGALVRLLAR